ncbi:unnamed protein product [Caenorhabditis angaria]|uniref:Uncharacterized protein n=1 Tax=Caenorhabditis angaria TaxID=860376 RepID=A0A9P1J2D2_9PELO|nr:unnamed protein product [Caenorhabditis angaria]
MSTIHNKPFKKLESFLSIELDKISRLNTENNETIEQPFFDRLQAPLYLFGFFVIVGFVIGYVQFQIRMRKHRLAHNNSKKPEEPVSETTVVEME